MEEEEGLASEDLDSSSRLLIDSISPTFRLGYVCIYL